MRLRYGAVIRWVLPCLTLVVAIGLAACGGAGPEADSTVAASDTAVPDPANTSPPADTATPEDTPTLAATVIEPTVEEPEATAEATGEAVTFQFPTMGSADAPVTIIEFSDYL